MLKYSFTILFIFVSLTVFSQEQAVRVKEYNLEKSLAIEGWDPVSYFAKKPRKGSSNQSYTYMGIKYYFSSEANKEKFKANPSMYEPSYGGWCAYAMGKNGEKVEVDPETYKIIDGKLYLFYNAYFNNTLKSWNKDEKNLKPKADQNWKKFIN